MTSALTQQWLRQVIGPYNDRDRVFTDVDRVLGALSSLRPKTDVYTFDDGRQQLLLCIHGLIPITFRQATYNIPVAIWITLNYPKEPPIAYVVPTSDMLVKPSQEVDLSGRCNTEYLQNWARKSEGCTLGGLVESMQEAFSRGPPVYAKPKDPPPRPPMSSQSTPITPVTPTTAQPQVAPLPGGPPPVPPVPSTLQSPLAAPTFTADGRPMPPPKPAGGSSFFTPGPLPDLTPTLTGNTSTLGNRPPPPLPGQPPAQAHLPPQPPLDRPPPPPWAQAFQAPSPTNVPLPQSPVRPSHHATSSSISYAPQTPSSQQLPYAVASPTRPAPPPPGAIQWTPPTNLYGVTPAVQSPPQMPPNAATPYQSTASPPVAVQTPPPPPPGPPVQPLRTAAPAPVVPVPDLMDAEDEFLSAAATEDSTRGAPVRPMNPELMRLHESVRQKILAEFQSFSSTVTEDAERLRATQTSLLHGEPAIRDEMARLVAVRDVCKSVADRMRVTVQTGEANVQELKRKGDPEVDELVCSTAIVYNQLINLVAEDNAIEDTIYHLHRALNSGRIDLDRFIKTTRVLAEEQFMKRALIQKITSGIPMGAAMNWT
ncbi:hypothetical protein FRC04_004593 [Tulasnella sp. 424]|nr:hypothetical protein FRC04_004593 [Tulasnella sp. 424]KAG8964134.1 hypothetical protein FRC05_004288 [Tulasnella sp. 425]